MNRKNICTRTKVGAIIQPETKTYNTSLPAQTNHDNKCVKKDLRVEVYEMKNAQ